MGIQGIQNEKNCPFSILRNLVIQNVCERLTLKINQDSYPKTNLKGIHLNLFFKEKLKILLIADWSKNKSAHKSLLTPEWKQKGEIRPENLF